MSPPAPAGIRIFGNGDYAYSLRFTPFGDRHRFFGIAGFRQRNNYGIFIQPFISFMN